MRRYLLLAIGFAALTVSHPPFAQELETPALQERAGAAAERAPAPERQAAPARERQAAPARARPSRQASGQPSQSSWTGSQIGGYGGGNVGGGGFSDKALLSQSGICNQMFGPNMTASSTPMQMPCTPGPGANGSMPAKFTLAGVISFDTPKIPVLLAGGNVVLIGAIIDIGTGTATSSFTQFNTYSTAPPIGPDAAGQRTNETITFSFRESVNSSLRAKVGVPIFDYWALVYFTAGIAVAKTEGSYSYLGTNFAPGCVPGTGCATNVLGSASFNQIRTGFSGGGGIEIQTRIPGLKVAFDYTATYLGSFSQTVPLVVTNCSIGAGLCSGGAEVVTFSHLTFQRVMVGLKLGL